MVAQLTGEMYLAVLAGAALVVAWWRFFVPVVFELNVDGVHQWAFRRHRQTPWRSIRGYEIFADGILLLPCNERLLIDALRGMYVPWEGHRDEVLASFQHYLAHPVQADPGS